MQSHRSTRDRPAGLEPSVPIGDSSPVCDENDSVEFSIDARLFASVHGTRRISSIPEIPIAKLRELAAAAALPTPSPVVGKEQTCSVVGRNSETASAPAVRRMSTVFPRALPPWLAFGAAVAAGAFVAVVTWRLERVRQASAVVVVHGHDAPLRSGPLLSSEVSLAPRGSSRSAHHVVVTAAGSPLSADGSTGSAWSKTLPRAHRRVGSVPSAVRNDVESSPPLVQARPAQDAASVSAVNVHHYSLPHPASPPSEPSARATTAVPLDCATQCHRDDLLCMARCSVGESVSSVRSEVTETSYSTTSSSAPDGGSTLPDSPSREDVARALASVRDAVRRCGTGDHGVASVTLYFAGTGRVTTSTVDAPYAGTPVGSCIARAVRTATLPPFHRRTFSVQAPFQLP